MTPEREKIFRQEWPRHREWAIATLLQGRVSGVRFQERLAALPLTLEPVPETFACHVFDVSLRPAPPEVRFVRGGGPWWYVVCDGVVVENIDRDGRPL